MMKKAVKGSAITDHLADNAIDDYELLDFDFLEKDMSLVKEEENRLDWWTMYFDGAINIRGNGVDAVIISYNKKQHSILVKLQSKYTNNITKYKACILGLEATLELNMRKIDAYRDSMLIIC